MGPILVNITDDSPALVSLSQHHFEDMNKAAVIDKSSVCSPPEQPNSKNERCQQDFIFRDVIQEEVAASPLEKASNQ